MRQRTYGLMASCLTVLVCMAMLGCSTGSDDSVRVQALEQQVEELQAAQEKQEKEEPAKTEDPTKTGTTTGKTLADTAKTPEAGTETTTTPPLLPTTGTTTPSTTTPPTTPTTLSSGTTAIDADKYARGLLAALETGYPADLTSSDPPSFGNSPATVKVTSSHTLKVEAGGHSAGSHSAPTGFTAARLTRASGGTTSTIVAYTDREVSRALLDHYGDFKASAEALQIEISASDAPDEIAIGKDTNLSEASNDLSVSHGFAAKKSASVETVDPKKADYFSGSVHGLSGQFRCDVSKCKVRLTPTYNDNTTTPEADRNKLASVTMDVVDGDDVAINGAKLYFKPSSASASVYLGPDVTVTRVVASDTEYMVFGWWRQEPSTPNGTHEFDVFADVKADKDSVWSAAGTPGTARYDGPAAGVYVEQGTAVEQGEFTATAHLTADFEGDNIGGYVDRFQAKPAVGSTASKSWRVDFASASLSSGVVSGGAEIKSQSETSTGKWEATFLDNHEHSRATQPLSAVGRFDARIESRLHLSGAFGVQRILTSETE